jgi:transporter, SSS family
VSHDTNLLAFWLFVAFIVVTLAITWWASKRTKSTTEFYTAGRAISGVQNGWAIAGDYMSAASFLGIAGIIALNGYDGFIYSLGFFVAYLFVLLVVAEPLRNTGKYTLADVLALRLSEKPVRSVAALSTLTISTFYMIAQLVGAGGLIKLLLGLDYELSIIIIGVLMTLYVTFGGMLATTWVQIIKAVLLMLGTALLAFLVLKEFSFNPIAFWNALAEKFGHDFLAPGKYLTNPWENLSLNLALVLGTAGLPHILIRFYTVPTAREARKSVVVAMIIIGLFYILTPLLGFGAAYFVGQDQIQAVNKAGNMAAPMLAEALGGPFFLAFISAVAFATILAVVAGLVISAASAFAHDFYTNVIRHGRATETEQVKVAKIASVGVGVASILLALLAKDMNVAYLVGLAFAVASSANVPVIVLTLFWKRFNTAGAVVGMFTGLVSSVGLVLISPNVMSPETAIYPLNNPALVSVPLGFLGAYLGTVFSRDTRALSRFSELYVRSQTGIGAE